MTRRILILQGHPRSAHPQLLRVSGSARTSFLSLATAAA